MIHSALPLPVPAGASSPATRVQSRERLFPVGRISWRTALWSPLLGFALVTPAMMAATFFPLTASDGKQFAQVAAAPFAGFLAHVLFGPAVEELLFRGLMLQLGKRIMPAWVAVVLSAVAFGALHFTLGPSRV